MRYGITAKDFWNSGREYSPWLQVVDDFLTQENTHAQNRHPSSGPACDVEETDSHFLMSFDLPGVSKEDVKIEVFDKQLTVSGERKVEKDVEKSNRLFSERFYGSFHRSFTLPSSVDSTKVEATYKNGVLQIALPKAESAKPRQIKIAEAKEA